MSLHYYKWSSTDFKVSLVLHYACSHVHIFRLKKNVPPLLQIVFHRFQSFFNTPLCMSHFLLYFFSSSKKLLVSLFNTPLCMSHFLLYFFSSSKKLLVSLFEEIACLKDSSECPLWNNISPLNIFKWKKLMNSLKIFNFEIFLKF